MKPLTIIPGLILSSFIFSSFSISPPIKHISQPEEVIFCETYTQRELAARLNPEDSLFIWINMEETDPGGSKIGTCTETDFKLLWNYIHSEPFQSRVQKDLIIAAGLELKNQTVPLYAIRKSTTKETFPSKQDLADVSIRKEGSEENYALFIKFSKSGTEKWASMTSANKGRDIAILYNGSVLAAPRLQEEIKNGECMISGKFTESEIKELKRVFEK